VIDPAKAVKLSEVKLSGHPESFRLSGSRAFINVPDAREIVTVDLDANRVTATWKQEALHSNFPLMLDDTAHAAVVFRNPARIFSSTRRASDFTSPVVRVTWMCSHPAT
jgi:hypothetical protein